jgi:two-component system alkaline phosphatase synthesis response regulator PhoP
MSTENPKILIIEDEGAVRAGLVDNLAFEGYHVVFSDNGLNGLQVFESEKPDLVILDVMMPGLDGLEVCRRIRASHNPTPIIMLTAKCSEVDKVVGLELGADDYLTKPFGMRELFARVKAVLRRYQVLKETSNKADGSAAADELNFGDVEVDFKTYRAKRSGQEIVLSAKEFELLRFLSSQPDVPVTRDQLLDQVWGYNNYPTTRTVDNFIARLRSKVEQVPERPKHILTVHGVGYKFVQ